MEGSDDYSFVGKLLTVDMYVTQPGDWIRVQSLASRREIAGRVGKDGIVNVEF